MPSGKLQFPIDTSPLIRLLDGGGAETIETPHRFSLNMPMGARVVSVETVGQSVFLNAVADRALNQVRRNFVVMTTGDMQVLDTLTPIGSFVRGWSFDLHEVV